MKEFNMKEKLNKSVIAIIVVITIAFLMPVKSKADIINDFIDLILRIPDGVMHTIDKYIGGSDEFTYEKLEFYGGWDKGGRVYNFIVTPYDIFSSGTYKEGDSSYYTKIGLLDINFFADKPITSETVVSSEILAPVIGNIYVGLRNLCMILMLLVILYIGIKIMVSSIAAQQAKYKQLLVDWLVGFCLLFLMHYIMSGIIYLNSIVVKMLSNEEGDSYYVAFAELEDDGNASQHDTDSTWCDVVFDVSNHFFYDGDDYPNKYTKFKEKRLIVRNSVNENGTFSNAGSNHDNYIDNKTGRIDLESVPKGKQDSNGRILGIFSVSGTALSGGHKGYIGADASKWGDKGVIYLSASIINPGHNNEQYENKAIAKLNAMSYVRTISSFGSEDNDSVILFDNSGKTQVDEEMVVVMGFSILYLCLVIETIMFTFTYIKRVLQMSFLTMIAPIVALMYPVDKIGDGKAQAFNTWFKDYLFNVLIQPMHLLLYTIFFVAANELISRNIIYALAVYGFMIPAEKYFKKILGFEKASTGGGGPLGGAIGRGLAMDGLGKLAGIGPAARGGAGGNSKNSKTRKPKTKKLTNSDDTTGPSGAGGPGSSGSPGAGGGGSSSIPGAPPPKKASSIFPAMGKTLANRTVGRAIKGATGGRYKLRDFAAGGKFRDPTTGKLAGKELGKAGLMAVGNGARFVGRKLHKGAIRAGGVALMGALGTVAGAATAMATGDINNLWKGATVGAAAGNKIGTNIGDRGEDFYDDFREEVKAARAESDPGYRAELRQDQAREAYDEFIDELPAADRPAFEQVRDKYAPYMDEVIKGDENMLKALVELENDPDFTGLADNYQKIAIAQEAASWSDLRESKRANDYKDYRAGEILGDPNKKYSDLSPAQQTEVDTRLRLARIAQTKLK